MVKINKKRIIFIICIISISFIAYEKKLNDIKTISTMSVPVTNKIIVVDAGHRG